MPLPTTKLNRRSSPKAIEDAISACISMLADEHPDWDNKRRVAACLEDARRHAGSAKVPRR